MYTVYYYILSVVIPSLPVDYMYFEDINSPPFFLTFQILLGFPDSLPHTPLTLVIPELYLIINLIKIYPLP